MATRSLAVGGRPLPEHVDGSNGRSQAADASGARRHVRMIRGGTLGPSCGFADGSGVWPDDAEKVLGRLEADRGGRPTGSRILKEGTC
jgi:hypothetical protein